jgi:hypothetical protein
MPDIRVTVTAAGEVTMDYLGFRGTSCLRAAAALKKVLAERYGVAVVEEQVTEKPELEEVAQVQEDATQVRQQEGR